MIGAISLLSTPSFAQQKDTTEMTFGKMTIKKIGDDSLLIVMKDFKGPGCKKHKSHECSKRYNGHWGGIDLGINGYMTHDFSLNLPANENYLDLKWEKSWAVNLNFFEQNFNLIKNKFGFTTGLGFEIHNYRFTQNSTLIGDSSKLMAYYLKDKDGNPVDLKTNKLVVNYLTLPILFEFQTNRYSKINSFHFGVGVIGGVRIFSHTKQYFREPNKEYFLYDLNNVLRASITPSQEKVKNRDGFHLNPFKLDATVRIGWSHLDLWGTYSFTPMFKKDKGPEVYPFALGISLTAF